LFDKSIAGLNNNYVKLWHYTQNQTGKLKEVKEKPFKLEKDIQKVFEENLSAIMGLVLVKSEFTIKNKRIDTLAYDHAARNSTKYHSFYSSR
jgi:hypothetical protein